MNKTFLVEFIEEYKKFPRLWRIKSEKYRDRNLKNKAYKHLLDKMREVDADATIQMVKNKIDSMRGCFRKELEKILRRFSEVRCRRRRRVYPTFVVLQKSDISKGPRNTTRWYIEYRLHR